MCQEGRNHPSPRAFFTNLQGPAPWYGKLRLLMRNNLIKLKNFQNCCGHPGEPGCWQGNIGLGEAVSVDKD